MTLHGFRAIARTTLDEALGLRPDYIEHPWDAGGGGTAGGGRFAFGNGLGTCWTSPFRRLSAPPGTIA